MLAGLFKQAEEMETKKTFVVENNVRKLTREEWELGAIVVLTPLVIGMAGIAGIDPGHLC